MHFGDIGENLMAHTQWQVCWFSTVQQKFSNADPWEGLCSPKSEPVLRMQPSPSYMYSTILLRCPARGAVPRMPCSAGALRGLYL